MNTTDNIEIKEFVDGIDWSTIPVINEISVYLNKPDTIELSKTCKYFRSKLSVRVFYQLTLFNQVYWSYREVNNIKLSGRRLKKLICAQIIEDLANKSKLVKKVVLTSRINPKLANLFFKKFKYCKSVIIDCKYDFKLATVYNILKHLNYLEVFFMEALYDHDPNGTLPPQNFKFPKTLKSIAVYPYILENNYIPAINDIDFSNYPNLIDWNITGKYDTDRFSYQQQPNIIHLYLCDVPIIDFSKFNSILSNNPQLKSLVYEIEAWSAEKLNTILTLPNLEKLLIINYSFDAFNLINFSLLSNSTIKMVIIECITPSTVIEELLTKLNSLEDVIFIRWNLHELMAINWKKFRGKFNSIIFGYSFYTENDVGDLFDSLKPSTKIIFDYNLKCVINYDLTF
ncbi:hypothetical protein CONCODRAFT_87185 [Conidiobolus coronatus NRRL 28638]|uniref:F-box domain-containing protein n=1 Tax=Conidiobolus coronatus (strain ATCC 28846 / CBS 209.66 / NRRL 28638) TaxID=796925 RepID=A0A137NWL9_CONC2|nr:hypothetical protein CONCODRAFT_87185 [Conidiobolus coronatus NRRL 28638]|eukprot:KXN67014.1 hypothetical protein CONCODRAFT_87185 [Conidiobolus coronatus NRRL 28638]